LLRCGSITASSSLIAPPYSSITHDDIESFSQSAFTKDNIAVLGTGINQATLSKLVEKSARYTLLRSSHHLRLPISVVRRVCRSTDRVHRIWFCWRTYP
ncbi:hypothetical protein BT96DRAFT_1087332, partial [Gymnopus androsaceus JB14]